MIRRQPISTHTDTPCPTRRASDLRFPRSRHVRGGRPWHGAAALYLCGPAGREDQRFRLTGGRNKIRMEAPCGPLFVLGKTWRKSPVGGRRFTLRFIWLARYGCMGSGLLPHGSGISEERPSGKEREVTGI